MNKRKPKIHTDQKAPRLHGLIAVAAEIGCHPAHLRMCLKSCPIRIGTQVIMHRRNGTETLPALRELARDPRHPLGPVAAGLLRVRES